MVDKLPHFKTIEELLAFFPDEQSCRDYFLSIRWPERIVCPHCHYSEKIYKFSNGKHFKCGSCKKRFTVRVGTIFEDSQLPLRKWFIAIYWLTSHKKGFSSHQLSRDLGVTQKTAWYMLHRIRFMISQTKHGEFLANVVEVDECYMGGKAKRGDKYKKPKRGSGSPNRVPIVGLVERDGGVRAFPIQRADKFTLETAIKLNVLPGSLVLTDENRCYDGISTYEYSHQRVNHSKGEYAKNGAHINTIEGFWGLMQRGRIGVYHYMSAKHLDYYCDEFTFRYSTRLKSTFERFNKALSKAEGRLTYFTLKGKPDIFNRRKKKRLVLRRQDSDQNVYVASVPKSRIS